jgi:hypothetical protein
MMNKQPTTLEQRTAIALQCDAAAMTSAEIGALIEDAKASIAEADKERAVDQALLSNLQARYQLAQAQERATGWLAEHDRLKGERDDLADELRELYPEVVIKIIDLFVRITTNNEALSALHQARPTGMLQHLLSAELHARGLDTLTRDKPSLLESTRLIDWVSGREAWPPARTPLAVLVAASVPRSQYRNPADWWKDNERRTAEQQADRRRVADYYERTKKEQEDRENAEARERFLAQQQLSINRPPKS